MIERLKSMKLLLFLSSQVQLNDYRDQMVWILKKQGEFTIKLFYKYLNRKKGMGTIHFPFNQIWKTKAPPRISCFAWKRVKDASGY